MLTRQLAINQATSFIKECVAQGLIFQKVLLFGSSVNGNTHSGSDIDLLLVSDQFNENPFSNLKLFSKINIHYPLIETHCYATHHYLEGNEFIQEISKDCIEIA
jgi:predicted nucleotidyltransferase